MFYRATIQAFQGDSTKTFTPLKKYAWIIAVITVLIATILAIQYLQPDSRNSPQIALRNQKAEIVKTMLLSISSAVEAGTE